MSTYDDTGVYISRGNNVRSGTQLRVGPTLNNAGDSIENPIMAGLAMRITVAKHSSSDTLQGAWVDAEDGRRKTLTSIAVENDETVTIDVVNGTSTFDGDPPTRNRLTVTLSISGPVFIDFYVATRPTVEVTLDGYDASDPDEPLVIPWA